MTEIRFEIRRRIYDDPGIHFNALVRELDLATGQTQYHIHRLLRSEDIISEELYGKTHYYPADSDPWDRRALALLRRETCRDILLCLLENEPVTPAAVTAEVDIARSTLEWHCSNLIEQGLIEKRYGERHRVTLHLTEPERISQLLADVTPSVPDRMIDRFTRIVDTILEDAGGDVTSGTRSEHR